MNKEGGVGLATSSCRKDKPKLQQTWIVQLKEKSNSAIRTRGRSPNREANDLSLGKPKQSDGTD
uniref:Uncharacterized protein n=1 Tax=Arion vulgaris TaxID=1028688 RepID=A0A0B7C3H7_9EUPU